LKIRIDNENLGLKVGLVMEVVAEHKVFEVVHPDEGKMLLSGSDVTVLEED